MCHQVIEIPGQLSTLVPGMGGEQRRAGEKRNRRKQEAKGGFHDARH
jgi:hypothetical protein